MSKKNMVVFVALFLPLFAFGQGSIYKTGETIRINTSDTLQKNVMAAGEVIEMMGRIDNDFFAASRHLILNGVISDDAFLAGEMVTLRGKVGDMMAGAGETVIIDGIIEGDLFAAGRTVKITANARINGNAAIAAETIEFEGGVINGWLKAAGNRLVLNGTVNNSVDIYSNDVTFKEQYEAAFSTTITSTEKLYRENLGVIPENLNLVTEEANVWGVLFLKFWFYISLLLTGLVLIQIFKQKAVDLHRFATEGFWKNTGVGLLAFIAVPIVLILLMLLVITIPLSILLGLVYGVGLFISYLLVAMTLGVMSIVYFKGEPEKTTYYWGLALGMIYVAILTNLPFIGGIMNFLLLLFGLGSLTHYIWKLNSDSRSEPTTE